MRIFKFKLIYLCLILLATSCADKVRVNHPPRLDLSSRGTIGVIDFSDNAEPSVSLHLTEQFDNYLHRAQTGIPILKLGSLNTLLSEVNEPDLNFRALQKIGQQYGVATIVHGRITYSDIETDFDLNDLKNLRANVKQTLHADLSIGFYESSSGAKFYSNSTSWNRKLSSLHVDANGNFGYDDDGRQNAYLNLIPDMMHDVTRDLRGTYSMRRMKK